MASSMTVKIGNVTATRTLGAGITDAKVGAALALFARSLGITVTGVALDDLLAIVDHFIDDVKRGAKKQQIADGAQAAQAALVAQAESDNAL